MYDETNVYAGAGVPREALIKKMKAIAAQKNIVLVAPGGYGKSVAAEQWLSSARGRTERVIAREADNDPTIFYTRLAWALARLVVMNRPKLPRMIDSFDKLLEVIGQFPKKRPRCYFALDDLHIIKNEELLANLPLIAAHLPDYIRCLLTGRAEPTPALLATGLFEVITKEDLLFSPEEVEWLGAEKNHHLNPEQIRGLLATTDGWAMYLSVILSIRELPNAPGDVKAPRTLTQYLESRVWALWDDETKMQLLRLSIPAEITPTLCARLTDQADGLSVLTRLTKKENAFLIQEGADLYRFHDIFHAFLTERVGEFLSEAEIRRLNSISAEWFYAREEYLESMRHYIANEDYEGINRCVQATNLRSRKSGELSVVNKMNFFRQYVLILPLPFIAESPYLLSKCVCAAFYDGDIDMFFRYLALFYATEKDILTKHPLHVDNYLFVSSLDFRAPIMRCVQKARELAKVLRRIGHEGAPREKTKDANVATITQNLPYFHRSMRDFSEFHALREKDLAQLKATFGVMIGRDWPLMEPAIFAGIHYERGELLEAARYALHAHSLCREDDAHPETVLSVRVILLAVLYAMGSSREADGVMEKTERYIREKASFLRPNFMALLFERAIRGGDMDAAREWLTVYANRSERLPFYQICRHFTTLRAHIALKDYEAATGFGACLLRLATDYNRPLDQIEAGLLLAIALWQNGEREKAVAQLERAIRVALPCGFTQLFINEGRKLLPLLWALGRGPDRPADFCRFTDKLTDAICEKCNLAPREEDVPTLSARQCAMLSYLHEGMTRNEIAAAADLAPETVKAHLKALYKKLGVHDAADAVAKATALGLLEK